MVSYLKKKWQIKSNLDFILILLVFSFAGMTVSFLRNGVFTVFGLNQAPLWEKIVLSILIIVPLYQCATLVFGLFLGQFDFFLERQKTIGRSIVRFVRRFAA